jgi:hypothetical protein
MAARVPAVLRQAQSAVRGRLPLTARLAPRGRPALPRPLDGRGRRIAALLALLGPGLIAANAGNDAGGVATYSQVGARYGYSLLWILLLITFSLALVQMLAARMGVVTGKGLAAGPRSPRWPC